MREDELKEFADWAGCSYVLTSAWQNKGIEVLYSQKDAFKKIVQGIIKTNKPSGPAETASVRTHSATTKGDKLFAKSGTEEKKTDEKKCC